MYSNVLHDKGQFYAYKLIQAGVNIASIYSSSIPGTIYDFVLLNALATPATCSAVGLVNENLRSILAKE